MKINKWRFGCNGGYFNPISSRPTSLINLIYSHWFFINVLVTTIQGRPVKYTISMNCPLLIYLSYSQSEVNSWVLLCLRSDWLNFITDAYDILCRLLTIKAWKSKEVTKIDNKEKKERQKEKTMTHKLIRR